MFKEVIILIGAPLVRSTIGWFKESYADGRISGPEWKKLITTIVRMGLGQLIVMLGLNSLGIDFEVLTVAFGGYLFDLAVYPAYKKLRDKFFMFLDKWLNS